MNDTRLSTSQLIQLIAELEGQRLAARTLTLWARRGLLPPSGRWDRERGRYHPRLYTLNDLAKARLIVQVRNAGVSMQRISDIFARLDDARLRRALVPGTRVHLSVDGWSGGAREDAERR